MRIPTDNCKLFSFKCFICMPLLVHLHIQFPKTDVLWIALLLLCFAYSPVISMQSCKDCKYTHICHVTILFDVQYDWNRYLCCHSKYEWYWNTECSYMWFFVAGKGRKWLKNRTLERRFRGMHWRGSENNREKSSRKIRFCWMPPEWSVSATS